MKTSRFTSILICAFLTMISAGQAQVADQPDTRKHIVVMIDLHGENPLRHPDYNQHAARLVTDYLQGSNLQLQDTVSLRTAGDPDPILHAAADWHRDVRLAHRTASPQDAAAFFAERIHAAQSRPEHGASDLMSAFSSLAPSLQCSKAVTSVLVLSNLIESGHLDGDTYHMPNLYGTPFAGCSEMVFIGAGVRSGTGGRHVTDAAKLLMTKTMKAAGFESVRFLN